MEGIHDNWGFDGCARSESRDDQIADHGAMSKWMPLTLTDATTSDGSSLLKAMEVSFTTAEEGTLQGAQLSSTPEASPRLTQTPEDLSSYYQFPSGNVTFPDSTSVRLEVGLGDSAIWDDTTDFAGLSGPTFSATSTIHLEYTFRVEPGDPLNGEWTIAGEIHGDNAQLPDSHGPSSPPFSVHIGDDQMAIIAIAGGETTADDDWLWLYEDPAPLQRGHDYEMTVDARFTDDGFLHVTRDGVTIVDYKGPLGYGTDTYWMPTLYRSASSETTAVVFSDMYVESF